MGTRRIVGIGNAFEGKDPAPSVAGDAAFARGRDGLAVEGNQRRRTPGAHRRGRSQGFRSWAGGGRRRVLPLPGKRGAAESMAHLLSNMALRQAAGSSWHLPKVESFARRPSL